MSGVTEARRGPAQLPAPRSAVLLGTCVVCPHSIPASLGNWGLGASEKGLCRINTYLAACYRRETMRILWGMHIIDQMTKKLDFLFWGKKERCLKT
ncbi:hypothetical protein HPG69_007545 [Diceros bicornis minor]|uniref:Uncharacterized protein n=1 Tax=Diceros bicornis minor TaxID=77932 RepID=A0A7J7EYR0_DICBM|nr:hypothetical protein HPG69_007545 [Diceros bicornis minor]